MSYEHVTVGINVIRYKDFNVYGIRGSGQAYTKIYEMIKSTLGNRIDCVWIDFPWHYFKFKHREDQDLFDQHIKTENGYGIDDRGVQETSFEEAWPSYAKYKR